MKRYRLLVLLLIVDVLLVFAHIFLRKKLGFFNLDKEGSLKAVFSGFQLLASGGAAALIAYLMRETARRWLWGLVAGGFLYLGLDEMMVIHERIGFVLNRWTGLTGYWGESFNWLIYFSPFIAVAFCVYFFLIRTRWREEKSIAKFFCMGTFFFAISLFFEVLGGKMLGGPFYQTSIVVEEASQLIGESFFLVGILLHLRHQFEKMYIMRL